MSNMQVAKQRRLTRSGFRMAALPLVALAVWATGVPANAHHSFAMFDKDKVDTIKATINKFEFRNPHSYIYADVMGKNGSGVHYTLELQGVNSLSRVGWRQASLNPGDTVTLNYYPLKNGEPGGLLKTAVLVNGSTLKN